MAAERAADKKAKPKFEWDLEYVSGSVGITSTVRNKLNEAEEAGWEVFQLLVIPQANLLGIVKRRKRTK